MSRLLLERRGVVGVARLHRPEALNALDDALVSELVSALEAWDRDPEVRAMVVTGGEKVFAAGADIGELAQAGVTDMIRSDRLLKWERLRRVSKPVIAAVAGFALGGGCELAMACDLLVAAEGAVFGQPEILLGAMPGAGGTVRLTRAAGRYRALDVCLTGRRFSAREAFDWGLVSRVVPVELLLEEAVRLADQAGRQAPLAARHVKESVHAAEDLALEDALLHERKLFYLLFGTEDLREGMRAFLEKRKAVFAGK